MRDGVGALSGFFLMLLAAILEASLRDSRALWKSQMSMNGEFTYAAEHLPQMLILIELCDDSGMMKLNGPSVHCVAKTPASWSLA